MRFTLAFFVFAAVVVAGELSVIEADYKKFDLELIGQTSNKLIFLSEVPRTYEAAQQTCKIIGARLLRILNKEEHDTLARGLDGRDVSCLWVGLELINTDTCKATQLLNTNCWHWEGIDDPAAGVSWNSEVITCAKSQTILSRGFYDKMTETYKFDDNDTSYPFLCEV